MGKPPSGRVPTRVPILSGSALMGEIGPAGLIGVGAGLAGLGLAALLDLGGLGSLLIRRLTSRHLGRLAPGYAATRSGLGVYAGLVGTLGLTMAGLGLSLLAPLAGVLAMGVGLAGFLVLSGLAITGEVRVHRARPGTGGEGR